MTRRGTQRAPLSARDEQVRERIRELENIQWKIVHLDEDFVAELIRTMKAYRERVTAEKEDTEHRGSGQVGR